MYYPRVRRHLTSIYDEKPKEPIDGLEGYGIKRKKLRIGELINMSTTPSNNFGRNIIFNRPFPLIKIASNRKNTNKSPELINSLLKSNKNPLSQTVKNMMKYNSFNVVKTRVDNDQPESKINNIIPKELSTKETEKSTLHTQRTLSLDHNDKGIQTCKETVDTFQLTSINKLKMNDYFDQNKEDQNKDLNLDIDDRLYTHRCIQSNRDLMIRRKLRDNNYQINGYKIKKKDHVMDKIFTDVALLKFYNHLRCIS